MVILFLISMAMADDKVTKFVAPKISPKVCKNHRKYLNPEQQKLVDAAKKAMGCK